MNYEKAQNSSKVIKFSIYSLGAMIVLFPVLLGSIYIFVEKIGNFFSVYLWILNICIFEMMFVLGIYILKKEKKP